MCTRSDPGGYPGTSSCHIAEPLLYLALVVWGIEHRVLSVLASTLQWITPHWPTMYGVCWDAWMKTKIQCRLLRWHSGCFPHSLHLQYQMSVKTKRQPLMQSHAPNSKHHMGSPYLPWTACSPCLNCHISLFSPQGFSAPLCLGLSLKACQQLPCRTCPRMGFAGTTHRPRERRKQRWRTLFIMSEWGWTENRKLWGHGKGKAAPTLESG